MPGERYAHAAVVFALAALAGWAQGVGAATIDVTAERHGAVIEIHASALLRAEVPSAWRVLTDYGHYANFIPGLRTSRVTARRGTTVTVDQSGDARLWLLQVPLKITFEIEESPPYGLHSRAVAGSMQAFESRYMLTPASSGVQLDYTGRVVPGFELLGRVEQYVVEQNVARQFQALVDEIERASAAAR